MMTGIFRIILFLLLTAGLLSAQYKEDSEMSGVGIPYFEMVVFSSFGSNPDSGLATVMVSLLYDDLTFTKSATGQYLSEYDLILGIYNSENEMITSRTLNKVLPAESFNETNKRDKTSVERTSFSLPTGDYTMFVKVLDINTNKSAQRKVAFKVASFTGKELEISDLLFLKSVTTDSSGEISSWTPSIGNNFDVRKSVFYLYFDAFVSDTSEPVHVNYKFSTENAKKDFDTTLVLYADRPVSWFLFPVKQGMLRHNRYIIEVTLSQKSGSVSVKKSSRVSFYWSEVPGTIDDIEQALEQMVYIAPMDSIKRYRDTSLEEKQKFFLRFWKERDPDPETSKNELKNEYYRRVNYANSNFATYSQGGWLSDQGRILIKFGMPDDIERHPFEIDSKPYVVWRYYSLRKTFLFEDRTGFGDYRLHPAYLDVEYQ